MSQADCNTTTRADVHHPMCPTKLISGTSRDGKVEVGGCDFFVRAKCSEMTSIGKSLRVVSCTLSD